MLGLHYEQLRRSACHFLPFFNLDRILHANLENTKHLKNVAHSLRAVLHCHSPGVANAATVARRLRIDVHDDDDDLSLIHISEPTRPY